MEFKNESIYATDIQVRNSIIRNAADQKWNICQEEGNRLRADLTYKRGKVFADIEYGDNFYRINPNLKYTTYTNKDGTVHRAVNNLISRLERFIKRDFTHMIPQEEEPLPIPRCVSFDYVDSDYLGIVFGAKAFITSYFSWANGPRELPKDAKFTILIKPSQNIPEEQVVSMRQRMQENLLERNMLASSQDPGYLIEVELVTWNSHSRGKVADFGNFSDAWEKMQAIMSVKDENGVPICHLDVSTRVSTSGFTGTINKSTNKVTAGLTKGALDSINKYLTVK